jgi:putative transposase
MNQYHNDTRQGIVRLRMNIKTIYSVRLTNYTIYRYMRLNEVQSIIRKKRKKYGTVQHHKIPNLLQRDFSTTGPNQKWSIDVSYLHCVGRRLYLCAIKDMFDKSIVSYHISKFNDNPLVFETLKRALDKTRPKQRSGLILHSDQGSQFTSKPYQLFLKENDITHSVSAKGSCVDNVPIESFFSALKSESIYLKVKIKQDFMIELVSGYIRYYNEERLQEQLKELTPIQYRALALQ